MISTIFSYFLTTVLTIMYLIQLVAMVLIFVSYTKRNILQGLNKGVFLVAAVMYPVYLIGLIALTNLLFVDYETLKEAADLIINASQANGKAFRKSWID